MLVGRCQGGLWLVGTFAAESVDLAACSPIVWSACVLVGRQLLFGRLWACDRQLYHDRIAGGTLSKTINVIEGVLRTGLLIPDGIARHRCDQKQKKKQFL